MKYALAIAVVASCFAPVCPAASPPAPSPEALLACAKLQDPAERVRCYDAQVATMSPPAAPDAATGASAPAVPAAAAPAPPPARAAAPEPSAPSASAVASSANVEPPPVRAAAPEPAASAAASAPAARAAATSAKVEQPPAVKFGAEFLPPASRPPAPEEERLLRSSITQVSKHGATVFLFSLSNGQVWREEGSQYTFFHAGDDVSIAKGALGSYRMSAAALGTKNWVRVTRIQ